ncbi:MAG: beta-eliminating lyase-related protein [Oligoflexia bacterium]|nr:beta-eliminating lyase-related protein [Oligoflexia bacterium]
MKLSEKEEIEIFLNCEKFLTHHPRKRPNETLIEIASTIEPEEQSDFYGKGEFIEDFEKDVAKLLGKEAAVFMPSGTMAQPIALRIWSDKAKNKNFGLHPTSHLENHEQHAYRYLHELNGCLLGDKEIVLKPKDIYASSEKIASLIIELPHRDLGGVLPEWSELEEMSAWCKKQDIRFHMDGARLWESAPYYKKDYKEICALFDSVYVSFYKGLGGVAGAILAGPKWFIEESRIWQRRQGGNLISLYPYVASARDCLKKRLSRMQTYHEHAMAIAEALEKIPEIKVIPSKPQTNMMHLIISSDLEKLEEMFLQIAQEKKISLFRKVERLKNGMGRLELSIGDATMEFSAKEVADLMHECIHGAKSK